MKEKANGHPNAGNEELGVLPCAHQHVVMPWWDEISLGGMFNSEVGNDMPWWAMKFHGGKWWDFPLAYPASTLIHKGGGLRQPPQRGVASCRPPFVDTLTNGCRGWADNEEITALPNMEFHSPPWSIISHHGIPSPTMGYHIPRWHLGLSNNLYWSPY